jgi:hypothetical protein
MPELTVDSIQSFKMAPIVKSHDLKYGYVQMEILDETTGLRFYWHNNKLANKPILLFPSGMVALVKTVRQAYQIYDDQVLRLAEAAIACGELVGREGMAAAAGDAPDIQDEVIYSAVIATSKVVQIKLEVSVYEKKLYIFLKKSSWSEEEGLWRPCRGAILLDRHQDDANVLLQFALSAHKE